MPLLCDARMTHPRDFQGTFRNKDVAERRVEDGPREPVCCSPGGVILWTRTSWGAGHAGDPLIDQS